jgi:hypothetical protein
VKEPLLPGLLLVNESRENCGEAPEVGGMPIPPPFVGLLTTLPPPSGLPATLPP